MSDSIILVMIAASLAALAWGFWHYFGQNALQVLTVVMLVCTAVDNLRLRRALRRRGP